MTASPTFTVTRTCTPTPMPPTSTPLTPGGCGLVCDARPCFTSYCQLGEFRLPNSTGYCYGHSPEGCDCEPFECPGQCHVTINPVMTNLVGDTLTLTGSARYYGYNGPLQLDVFVDGGLEAASGAANADGSFELEVPLRPGLNILTVDVSSRFGGGGGPAFSCAYYARHDSSGNLLDVCACAEEPCACFPTTTPTTTETPTPPPTMTPCNGACPTTTPAPTHAPTCAIDLSGRSPTPTA